MLSCRRETAQRAMSLEIPITAAKLHRTSHSIRRMSLKVAEGHRKLRKSIGDILLPISGL